MEIERQKGGKVAEDGVFRTKTFLTVDSRNRWKGHACGGRTWDPDPCDRVYSLRHEFPQRASLAKGEWSSHASRSELRKVNHVVDVVPMFLGSMSFFFPFLFTTQTTCKLHSVSALSLRCLALTTGRPWTVIELECPESYQVDAERLLHLVLLRL